MASKQPSTSQREHRKRAELGRILFREEVQARVKLVTSILKKDDGDRTAEDQRVLETSPDVVDSVVKRRRKRAELKEREKEIEDSPEVLAQKCKKLAEAIRKAKKSLVIYTGAGISTAASIPDYRGPNGVWTLLQKGKEIGNHELSEAEPTLTHMAIADLHKKGYLLHVVSQNCDGLHLRSGLPRTSMSEVHGNMYIEVCIKCRPVREYVRLFDVTERTSIHKHKTGRKCHACGYDLIDTIVHFGEKGVLKNPLNWSGAVKAADKCKMILCLGSSLKVLRRYTCLWGMDRPQNNRPVLAIVNLQWTPKDNGATIKINGKCDEVIKQVMKHLDIEITPYQRDMDPIFKLAKPLKDGEENRVSRKLLCFHKGPIPECSNSSSSNSIDDCKLLTSDEKMDTKTNILPCNGHTEAKLEDVCEKEIVTGDKSKADGTEIADKVIDDVSCLPQIPPQQSALDKLDKVEDKADANIPNDGVVTDKDESEAAEEKIKSEQITDDSELSDNCDQTESDSDTERPKKPVSSGAPGWFGKGMKKLPRKRKKQWQS